MPVTRSAPARARSRRGFARSLGVPLLAALLLAIVVKAFVVQAFYIPSDSMEHTLHGCPGCHGDRVIVDKLVTSFRGVHRGDVVVFDGRDNYGDEVVPPATPGNPVVADLRRVAGWVRLAPTGTDYIKRVIGLPGDHVRCCDARNRITVDGVAVDEPYVYLDPVHSGGHRPFDVIVPKGKVWVMGDHRNDSLDSRYVGPVPEKDIVGRAFAVIWPAGRWHWLGEPAGLSAIGKSRSG